MPSTLTMPKLSPTMEEGTIVKWHKKPGDKIDEGDLLIEIATDKATVEFNALEQGWLGKILISEGKNAIVNQPIAILKNELNENIENFKVEEFPAKQSEASEALKGKISSEEEKTEEKKVPLPETHTQIKVPAFLPEEPIEDDVTWRPSTSSERVLASPLAKKLAQEQGLDLTNVKGSGPNGRIMSRDLEKAGPVTNALFGKKQKPKYKAGEYEEVSLSQMRKTIAQRLQESKTFIPHFYVSQTINAEPLEIIREQLKVNEVKLTINDFVIKACALALRQHKNVNTGFNSVQQSIIKFKTVDISVAVSLPEGLITPIIRFADFKNLAEISAEIRQLSKRAKEGKLQPQEYKGGSFTISNLGMYGVTDFSAIINPPQAAILAVSGIHTVPVVKNNKIIPGKTMNITLSVDHRVIDGVMAAEFIKTVQKFLENPANLLI